MALITLEGASVILDARRVLAGIDWRLGPGTHWAVHGGNGAGKTCFLKLLAGELWPAPGGQRVYDFGEGPQADAVHARARVRLVTPELQDRYLRLRRNLRADRFIATGFADSPLLRQRLSAAEQAAVDAMVVRCGLSGLMQRPLLQLSRGEQRRLLIARALVAAPDVLLLDEVCDGLDAAARDTILQLLDEVAASGCQLVFATHRPAERPSCLNHWLRLDAGRISDQGRLDAAAPPAVSAHPAVVAPETTNANLIVIANADVYRDERRVLEQLNWRLRDGERWWLRGANGAGKSTFIKLLNGDLRPAVGGSIDWFGLPSPPNIWAVRSRLGLVSDELQALYGDDISVVACIATGFNASIGRVPELTAEQCAAVESAIGLLDLHRQRDARIRSLSYGQFRRVLLARAVVQRPAVLLLDEPFSGLDSRAATLSQQAMMQLANAGTALVVASHDAPPQPGLFNRQLVLAGGRAVAGPD